MTRKRTDIYSGAILIGYREETLPKPTLTPSERDRLSKALKRAFNELGMTNERKER